MREYEADILQIEPRGPSAFLIDLVIPDPVFFAIPGQFVQVRISDGADPFLRRPFSLCGAEPKTGFIRLMIDAIGRGTCLLRGLPCGGKLNLIGPLGAGFDPELGGRTPCILVAGGLGAAPLVFLANWYGRRSGREVVFMIGARNEERLAVADNLIERGAAVMLATEDGSREYHGPVTGLLEKKLAEFSPGAIFTCGPRPMLRAVAEIARRAGIPCQVSLEERMACGIGACLGCAVQLADGSMARVCANGPVFDAEEIAW